MPIPKIQNQQGLADVRARLNEVIDQTNANPWRGVWNAETIYRVNDRVSHARKTWVASQDNYGHEPALSSEYWTRELGNSSLSRQVINRSLGI